MTTLHTSDKWTCVLLALCVGCVVCSQATCPSAVTSAGVLDLHNGEMRCAAPASLTELGLSYVWCWGGRTYTMPCPPGTRFNTKLRACAWSADCGGQTGVPTTTTTTPAPVTVTSCNNETCQLPDCFCFGAVPDLNQTDLPMFVLLSFDDAVTSSTYSQVYQAMLVDKTWGILNPNNCSIRASFFVTDQPTDYSLVQQLHLAGHEISSHGVNHTSNDVTYQEVADEIVGMRDIIVNSTDIPPQDVTGFRSPYLMLYADHQFDVLSDYNFTYDSSITNVELAAGRKPVWPFTLDFPIQEDRCPNKPCPVRSHPGVWEVPLNGWVGNNSYSCGMIDGCGIAEENVTGTVEEYMHYFQSNFDKFYEHKVPMHMFTHAAMFMKDDDALPALRQFMEALTQQHDDVWFVTPSQLIDWMKNPTSKSEMSTDSRFSC